jgi:broad specificity phosphatase PhoE
MNAMGGARTAGRTARRAVWLARHGSRLDFEDAGWHRRAPRPHDPPISRLGEGQARALAAELSAEPIDALFSSPFLRCVQTARFIAEALGLPIRIEPGLSEWLNAAWFPNPPDALPLAELARVAPQIDRSYEARGAARHGESGVEALRRSGETVRRLVRDFDGSLVLVGHAASLLGAAAGLLGIDPASTERTSSLPEIPYGGLVRIVQRDGGWTLEPRHAI